VITKAKAIGVYVDGNEFGLIQGQEEES